MSKNAIYPATLMTLMAAYIALLSHKSTMQDIPTPVYAFYDTTYVHVSISPATELYDVYGIFNNILEGQKEIVKADILADSTYRLAFRVNSPRPAFVYINDEAVGVFLTPDSTLNMEVDFDMSTFHIKGIDFEGHTAQIAEYYRQKSNKLHNIHIRSNRNTIPIDDFCAYSAKLDSMSESEITFLARYNLNTPLPDWFIAFEQSEIAYHKAYLKLSSSTSHDQSQACTDSVALNNEEAIFSYYYYLYLKAYISSYLRQNESLTLPDQWEAINDPHSQLQVADTLLEGNVHDVFFTRTIFILLQRNQVDLAENLLEKFRDNFNSKKYTRFLDYQFKQVPNRQS